MEQFAYMFIAVCIVCMVFKMVDPICEWLANKLIAAIKERWL